jgi:hypothetical protein
MGTRTCKIHELEPHDPLTSIGVSQKFTNLDPHQAAALSARAKKTTARIAAAKAKAEARDRHQAGKEARRLAKAKEKQRNRTEAEAEAQQRKKDRDAAEVERTNCKAQEKQEEREAREERKRQDEQERQDREDANRRKVHLAGVAWGFDDRAGTRTGVSSEDSAGCYASDGRGRQAEEAGTDNLEEFHDIGRRTGRRWHRGNTWGIEAGGPGKEVQFESSTPISPKRPKKLGDWRR